MTTTTTTTTDTVAQYARTFSATTRHIVRLDNAWRTLCGQNVALPEFYLGDDGIWKASTRWVYELPQCDRCRRSAEKRGIVADTRQRYADDAHVAAMAEDVARSA